MNKTGSKGKNLKVELTEEQIEECRNVFKIYDPQNEDKMNVSNLKVGRFLKNFVQLTNFVKAFMLCKTSQGAMRALGFEPRKEEIKQLTKSLKVDDEGRQN